VGLFRAGRDKKGGGGHVLRVGSGERAGCGKRVGEA
jgi:hypothetical protein